MSSTQQDIITCPDPPIDSFEKHGYLFGYPIAHSLSPLFHCTIFKELGWNWENTLLSSTDIEHFLELLKDPRTYGSSVTMPNKVAIIPHLDGLAPEGRAVGAVNTIFRRGSQFIGTNTDILGVKGSFYENVADPDRTFHHRPGLVIGGGGAARSAVYALKQSMRCETVYLVNRDPGEVVAVMGWCKAQGYGEGLVHVSSVAQAEGLEGAGAIVACVPNFPPVTTAEKEARAIYEVFLTKEHKAVVLEMCYHPNLETEISDLAEQAGLQVIPGTEAMIYQGLAQAELWTGKSLAELPVKQVKEVIAAEMRKSHD